MRICWDTLENIEYNPQYGFKMKNSKNRMYMIESEEPCLYCGEYFLHVKSQKYKYCTRQCSQTGSHHNFYKKKRPRHSKLMKLRNPMFYIDTTGNKNPNWKGGLTEQKYCSGWPTLSEEIRNYYKKCQNPNCCGKSNRMTTHHIDYNKQNCHPANLICLCHICNAKANGNRDYHEKYYRRLKENEQNNCIERRLHIFEYSKLETRPSSVINR